MPYTPLPLKPGQGKPWLDYGNSVYDNVAQLLVDLPALKADAATTTAQAAQIIATRAPINSPTFTGTVSGVTKAHVGLGNVDNTADAEKVFTAAQITTGTIDAARLPAQLAGIRTRTPANEQTPTASNWQPRPAGFGLVVAVGAPPAPSDAQAGDLHVPLTAVAATAGTTFGQADGTAWPAPWVVAKMPTGGSAVVTANEGRLTTGSAVGAYSSTDAVAVRHSNQAANVDITFTVRRITNDSSPALVLRADNATLDPSAGLVIPMSGTTVTVSQVSGWTYTAIGTPAAKPWTVGAALKVRVSAQGSTIRVRQWPAASTEPATWDVTATTTATATGYLGFVVKPGNTAGAYVAAVDDITVQLG